MNSVLQVYNDDDVRLAVKSRDIRQRVGTALGRFYPHTTWLVDVNLAGGVVNISCPTISRKYGMVLHLTRDNTDLEVQAVSRAGELLERFRVSRETGRSDHLKRSIDGEAMGVKDGGQ